MNAAYALLREALDLVPRMSEDDPIAPALADWCYRARSMLKGAVPFEPAPWSINEWPQPDADIRIGAPGCPLIATVHLRDTSINQQLANARLILMAPVMAHLLREIVDSIAQLRGMCGLEEESILYDAADATLDFVTLGTGVLPALPPPKGYALIGLDALRAWGKLGFVVEECRYPINSPAEKSL